jgi:hypothetical protein
MSLHQNYYFQLIISCNTIFYRKKWIISFGTICRSPPLYKSPTHTISEAELHQLRGLPPITRDHIRRDHVGVFLDTSPPQRGKYVCILKHTTYKVRM